MLTVPWMAGDSDRGDMEAAGNRGLLTSCTLLTLSQQSLSRAADRVWGRDESRECIRVPSRHMDRGDGGRRAAMDQAHASSTAVPPGTGR